MITPRHDGSGGNRRLRFVIAVLLVAACVPIRWCLTDVLESHLPFMLFIPSVVLAGWYGGRGPALLACGLSAVAAFVLAEQTAWGALPLQLRLTQLGLFLVTALLICGVTEALHRAARRSRASAREFQDNEEEYRATFELSGVGQAQADPVTGRYLRVNRKMCDITGYSREELLAMSFIQITHPDDRDQDLADNLRMVRGDMPEQVVEKRYIRKDGSVVWVNVTSTVIRDTQGRPLRTTAVIQDITDRKLAEAERENLQRQLAGAQRLDSVNQLAAGIAHSFNNLLAVIMGNASLYLDDENMPRPIRQAMNNILAASERGAGLATELLRCAGRNSARSRCDFKSALDATLALLNQLRPPKVRLAIDLVEDLPRVRLSEGQATQLLLNLCLNGLQACEGGGEVMLHARTHQLDAEAAGDLGLTPGAYLRLEVEDTGCGMDAHTLERIFEPFFTTRQLGQGLGLSSARGIVLSHGGQIRVRSKPGQGTTVTVWLPVEQSPTNRQALNSGPWASAVG